MAEPPHYRAYLAGDRWRERRALALKAARYKCDRCGKHGRRGGAGLQVHHLSYDRLGSELPEDLEVLCDYCHRARHSRLSRRERHRISAAAGEAERMRAGKASVTRAKADLIEANERLHLRQNPGGRKNLH